MWIKDDFGCYINIKTIIAVCQIERKSRADCEDRFVIPLIFGNASLGVDFRSRETAEETLKKIEDWILAEDEIRTDLFLK